MIAVAATLVACGDGGPAGQLGAGGTTSTTITVTTGPGGCQLDLKQGPDKAVYYSDAGAIYRMG